MRKLLAATAAVALLPAVTSGADAPASTAPGPICGAHAPAKGPSKPDAATAKADAPKSAGPDWTSDPPPPAEAILVGYGTGGFKVRTSSDKAQAFFDNGMQLGHAFAHRASVRAFEAAARADPDCAMCVWGVAWSRGPTINFGIDEKTQVDLAALADKAAKLAEGGPPLERELTAAMQLRYHKGGGGGDGDRAYARAMDRIAREHPDDSELQILAADAWLIPVANSGNFAPRNPDVAKSIALLQPVLARNPDDTGAIHFYIHSTEIYGDPGRALPYALRLQALAPAASHLVHMPSHTYIWVGRYEQAVQANLDASAIDQENAARLKTKDGAWGLVYHSHNVTFGTGAALMSGDAAAALQLARPVADKPEPKLVGRMTVARAYFAMGRYADPAEVFALPDPGALDPFTQAMWRYARGEAAARRGDAKAVRAEAARVTMDPGAFKGFEGWAGEAQGVLKVTRLVLEGRADMLEHKPADAAKAFGQAADVQEKVIGGDNDPPIFWYPVRRSLADADLALGRPADAEAQARRSLRRSAEDPITLVVLAKAEDAQGRRDDAAKDLARARTGWKGGDPEIGPAGA